MLTVDTPGWRLPGLVFCCLLAFRSIVFSQEFKDIYLISEQGEPVSNATIFNRRSGSVYFTGREGRVRIFGAPPDTIEVRQLIYARSVHVFSALAASDTVYLREISFSLPEVPVRYDVGRYYRILNQLARKARIQQPVMGNFTYRLESFYQDTLVEKSDGLIQASVGCHEGFEQIEFVTGQYAFRQSFPFLNLRFTDYCQFFQPFKTGAGIAVFTPFNNRNITEQNTAIDELPCPECEAGQVLLQLYNKNKRTATVEILLDTARLQIGRLSYSVVDSAGRYFKPIVKGHSIRRMAFKNTYFFNSALSVTAFQVQSAIHYVTPHAVYPDIGLNITFWQTTPAVRLVPVMAGGASALSDVEKIAVAPYRRILLDRSFHRRDVEENTLKYRSLNASDIIEDNRVTIAILNALGASKLKIWADSSCTGPFLYSSEVFPPDKNFNETPPTRFEFAWHFLLEDSAGRIRVYDTPACADAGSSYFESASAARAGLYFNLLFDYCELKRRELRAAIDSLNSIESAHKRIQEAYAALESMIGRLHIRSGSGRKLAELLALNDTINEKLEKDNFKTFIRDYQTEELVESPYSLADILAMSGELADAVSLYDDYIDKNGYTNLAVVANRMECSLKLGRMADACLDYKFLSRAGYKIFQPERFSECR